MWHHTPLRTRSNYPPQTVEHISQIMLSLRCVFFHQGQVRSNKCPFVIAYVTGICFSGHPQSQFKSA